MHANAVPVFLFVVSNSNSKVSLDSDFTLPCHAWSDIVTIDMLIILNCYFVIVTYLLTYLLLVLHHLRDPTLSTGSFRIALNMHFFQVSSLSFDGWCRGTVAKTSVLAGELSLLRTRPSADEWPRMWVNHPLEVSQPGQLGVLFSRGR